MGDEPQKQDTQANKRSPLLSEEVPYQITLIRLRQWQPGKEVWIGGGGRKSSGRCKLKLLYIIYINNTGDALLCVLPTVFHYSTAPIYKIKRGTNHGNE